MFGGVMVRTVSTVISTEYAVDWCYGSVRRTIAPEQSALFSVLYSVWSKVLNAPSSMP